MLKYLCTSVFQGINCAYHVEMDVNVHKNISTSLFFVLEKLYNQNDVIHVHVILLQDLIGTINANTLTFCLYHFCYVYNDIITSFSVSTVLLIRSHIYIYIMKM